MQNDAAHRAYSVDDVFQMADSGDDKHIPTLLDLLTSSDDIRVKGAAAAALGELGAQSAIPKILELMRDPATLGKRGSFASALIQLNCLEHLKDVVQHLTDPYFEVRQKVLIALEDALPNCSHALKTQLAEQVRLLANADVSEDVRDHLQTALELLR